MQTPARQYLRDVAWDVIVDNPIGLGWGGFGRALGEAPGESGRLSYPHNLLLEVLVEGGWLPGIGVAGLIAVALYLGWQKSLDPTIQCLFALTMYWLINSQVSSDINGNRMLWITATALWVASTETIGRAQISPRRGAKGEGRISIR